MTKQTILILLVAAVFVVGGFSLYADNCPAGTTNCITVRVQSGGVGQNDVKVKIFNGTTKIEEADTKNGAVCFTGLTVGTTYTLKCKNQNKDVTVPNGYCGQAVFQI